MQYHEVTYELFGNEIRVEVVRDPGETAMAEA